MQPRTHARGPWRLSILAALGLALGACAPAAAPPSVGPSGTGGRASDAAPAAPAGQPAAAPAAPSQAAEWDRTVAAARQEGKVVCGCTPFPVVRELLTGAFEQAYPGIQLEYIPAPLPQFPARVEAERAAGQYLWDLYFWGPGPEIYALAHQGVFEPILPAL